MTVEALYILHSLVYGTQGLFSKILNMGKNYEI